MKKKRKVIIVVISILIILLVILSVFLAKKYLHSEAYNESKLAYHLDDKKINLDLCKKDNCIHAGNKLSYPILTLDYKIDSLQNEVEKINKKTEKIYKEDNNSSTSSPTCSKVKDTYKKRYVHTSSFEFFENDKYISLSVQRTKTDFCTDEASTDQAEISIYDKNKKKIISQESFIKNIKISKSNILKAINESLDNYLMNYPHYDETFTQYKVYYITNGDLVVSYKLPDVNSYNVATLKATNN